MDYIRDLCAVVEKAAPEYDLDEIVENMLNQMKSQYQQLLVYNKDI